MRSTHPASPAEPARPRHLHSAAHRVLERCGWVTAAGMLILLLSTACPPMPLDLNESETTATAREEQTEIIDEDPAAADANVDDTEAHATATPAGLGGNANVAITATGADTQATATVEQQICFEARVTDSVDLFVSHNYQNETDCNDVGGFTRITTLVTVQKNNDPPIEIRNGTAVVGCTDTSVAVTGNMPQFTVNIPRFRYSAFEQISFPDQLPVVPGDKVTLSLNLSTEALLPPGAEGRIKASGNILAGFDFGFDLTNCGDPQCPCFPRVGDKVTLSLNLSREAAGEGLETGEFCERGACIPVTVSFASEPLNFVLTTNPDPLSPGQPLSLRFGLDVHQGDLQIFNMKVRLPRVALTFNGVSTVNQGAGGCAIGPFNTGVLTTGNPNQFYVDLNGNVTPDAPDITITVRDDPDPTKFVLDIAVPHGGDGDASVHSIPINTRLDCQGFFGFFTAGVPGNHTIEFIAISVDPDTGGPDDGTGISPLTITREVSLVIPGDFCGNGILDPGEECDDGNTVDFDSCTNLCTVAARCGDGEVDIFLGETCDDFNKVSGDGCSATCTLEPGYTCTPGGSGQPSLCTPTCGDGLLTGIETCDDGNLAGSDGCSSACQEEVGYDCTGQPSSCTPTCGDGLLRGSEACDDGNIVSGDGCASCAVESGFTCTEEPSVCTPICTPVPEVCGDGIDQDCDGQDLACPPVARPCDVDGDGDVDRNDNAAIMAARNTVAAPGDARDVTGRGGNGTPDGRITIDDARYCALRCDKPRCAP